jgi:hypothetical protein
MERLIKKVKYLIFLYLVTPFSVFAAPLIDDPAAGPAGTPDDVFNFVNRVKNIALGFVGVIIFAMLIYGGVLYITSGGNDEKIQKAKQTLTAAIIGLLIVLLSYVIISFVVNSLGGQVG